MTLNALTGIALAVAVVVVAYRLGYHAGHVAGRDDGYDDGHRQGKKEGSIRGYAVGFDRGRRHEDPDEDDAESKPKLGLAGVAITVVAIFAVIALISGQGKRPSQTSAPPAAWEGQPEAGQWNSEFGASPQNGFSGATRSRQASYHP